MAREIDWTDAEEIGILLQETYPEIEPYSVRFTDLHKYVIGLPGFVGDPAKSNEGIVEAIQTAWNEAWEDAHSRRPPPMSTSNPKRGRISAPAAKALEIAPARFHRHE